MLASIRRINGEVFHRPRIDAVCSENPVRREFMNQRDRIGEIAANKKRNARWHGLMSFDIESLKAQFENSPEERNGCTDFYLIRCVTFLEVFTRSNIAALVDHSKEYTDRAVE